MAAKSESVATDGKKRTKKQQEALQQAEALFWLQPRFTRWAMARVLQQPAGGDLSLQQLTVLYLVRTEGVTLAELARRCMVAPTVITGIVDRLERQNFIRREADPHDRRVNRLVLTEEGTKVGIEVEKILVAEVADQMEDFTDAELQEMARGIALLERLLGRLAVSRTK